MKKPLVTFILAWMRGMFQHRPRHGSATADAKQRLSVVLPAAMLGMLFANADVAQAQAPLRVRYKVVFTGRFAVSGTYVRTLPLGESCFNAGVPLYRGILPIGLHGVSLNITPADDLGPNNVPPLDRPYTNFEETSSVGLGGDPDIETFGINMSRGSGSLTYHSDGSGEFEFSGWKNSLDERESGLIRWTCRPSECQGTSSPCRGDVCKQCRDGFCEDRTDEGQPFSPDAAKLHSVAPPSPEPIFEQMPCMRGDTDALDLHIDISARCDGGRWTAVLSGITQDYYVATRLLPGEKEVTGPPPGNSTQTNYCQQVREIFLRTCTSKTLMDWGLVEATEEHEKMHVESLRKALRSAVPEIELRIDALWVPTAAGKSQAQAVHEIRSLKRFEDAVVWARTKVRQDFQVTFNPHHGDSADAAAERVIRTMQEKICGYARQVGWPSCFDCP